MAPKTMFEKIWDAHVVSDEPEKPALLYVDLHLVHEITSAQAFDGLRMNDRRVRRTDTNGSIAAFSSVGSPRARGSGGAWYRRCATPTRAPIPLVLRKMAVRALVMGSSPGGAAGFDSITDKHSLQTNHRTTKHLRRDRGLLHSSFYPPQNP